MNQPAAPPSIGRGELERVFATGEPPFVRAILPGAGSAFFTGGAPRGKLTRRWISNDSAWCTMTALLSPAKFQLKNFAAVQKIPGIKKRSQPL